MKSLYIALAKHTGTEVPELKWIDLDYGQIDTYNVRPMIITPSALFNISFPNNRNYSHSSSEQDKRATIQVRVAFDAAGTRTSIGTPAQALDRSLAYIDTAQKVYDSLQGFTPNGWLELEGTSFEQEKRSDGMLVMRMTFTAEKEL